MITVEGWRADAAGFLGGPERLTPVLDGLAARSDWAGPAVASSSASAPALASVLTGLNPWRHRLLARGDALPDDVLTLAQALAGAGYNGRAFRGRTEIAGNRSLARGFERWEPLSDGSQARRALAELTAGQWVWIHLAVASGEYRRRDTFLDRLPPEDRLAPGALPRRKVRSKLMRRVSPGRPLEAAASADLRALYRTEVAHVDSVLGSLLASWEQGAHTTTALVVVGTRGEELGENGRVGDGRSLERSAIEIPLVLLLPEEAPPLRVATGERVSADRLWATLVALGGARAPAGVAPSLFATAEPGILSELYGESGDNQFSWLAGPDQLIRSVRFADVFERRARAATREERKREKATRESRRERRRRQERAFRQTLPWSGPARDTRIERSAIEWMRDGSTMRLADPGAATPSEQAALRRWLLFVGAETTPEERKLLY